MQDFTSLAWLIGNEGTPNEFLFELTKKITTLGRGSDNDIQIDDPLASRRHAVIQIRVDGYQIVDQNSSNGTFVNDEVVTTSPLFDGDLIQIGSTFLRLKREADPDATIMQKRPSEDTIVAMRPTIPHEHGAVHCRSCGQPNSKGGKYCFKCGKALPQLPASFQKKLDKFNKLQTAFKAGELTRGNYQAALKNLLVQDDEGDYWMLGVESGEWYWFDGDEWHLRLPPLILGDKGKTQEPSLPAAPGKTSRGRWGAIGLWLIGALIVLVFGVYTAIEYISYSRFNSLGQSDSIPPAEVEESFESIDTVVVEPTAAPTPTVYAQDTRNEINVRPYDPAIDGSVLSIPDQTEYLPDQSSEEHVKYEGFFPYGNPGLLIMAWCAIDQTTLESNMASVRMEGTFDSIIIPPEMWTVDDSQEQDIYCRFFRAVVEDLEPGTHKFFWATTYDVPINDGWETYQPGTYINEFIIKIEDLYTFSDDFNSSAGHWGETERDEMKVWIEGGELHFELYQSSLGVMSNFREREFDDFMVIARARSLSENPGSYGIIFRKQDDQTYYFFEITDEGSFRLGKNIGETIDLIPWTQSESILKDGSVNRLAVSMEGDWILVLINGEVVVDLHDTSIKDGKISLAATSPEEVEYFHAAFQQVSIEAPK